MTGHQIRISFQRGSISIHGLEVSSQIASSLSFLVWEPKVEAFFAEGRYYKDIILYFYERNQVCLDEARAYQKTSFPLQNEIIPRDHQARAKDAWLESRCRGVVSLPTGAGKTILAVMCIAEVNRPTLVIVPTIDLVRQWERVLKDFFQVDVGILGAGERRLSEMTVATYDSAALLAEEVGGQFGLLVFDECHHLPSPQNSWIARCSIAPFRLGLSATIERSDGKEADIYELLGPKVYDVDISQVEKETLSPYDVVTIELPLSDREMDDYQQCREKYIGFVKQHRISLSSRHGWSQFLKLASYMPGGKEALKCFRDQKKIAEGSEAKLCEVWDLLIRHKDDRVIIFTNDNALAYKIGKRFILPVLTHQTKASERKMFLESFAQGKLTVLVTSKVLNEGVDVPDAAVAIVVSGNATVREHVQRLGRVLRHRPGKRAVLYELISKETSEFFVNKRRKQHSAYQGLS